MTADPAASSTRHSTPPSPRPVIGRQLITGFALVSLVALAMCGVLSVLLSDVAHAAQSMRDGEKDVRESLALAMAVREQYIHQAHTIVEGNHSHLTHYRKWVDRVNEHAAALQRALPAEDSALVVRVLDESRELDRVFGEQLVPALDRGDSDALRTVHRVLERLSVQAATDADALAGRAESRMASEHTKAMTATHRGFATSMACMLLVVLFSVSYTRRIRRAVVEPLNSLVAAAIRFGQGDFTAGVGRIGGGEFESVSWAWNRMLEKLREREDRIVQAERMAVIGQLAAGVAHEINNPIGVIRGYLRTMSPEDAPDTLREELKILDDEAAACQRIAEDLLAFARDEELSTSPVSMDELLCETARRFSESGEAGVQGVEVDAESATILADGRRLRQVVLNLLRNAVQAAPDGSPVEVSGRRLPGHSYEIRVLDRGSGVAEPDVRRIFEPFYSKRDGGTGLGLAVCSGIVRAHGGEIRVERRPGGGSAFCVILPPIPPIRPGADKEGT